MFSVRKTLFSGKSVSKTFLGNIRKNIFSRKKSFSHTFSWEKSLSYRKRCFSHRFFWGFFNQENNSLWILVRFCSFFVCKNDENEFSVIRVFLWSFPRQVFCLISVILRYQNWSLITDSASVYKSWCPTTRVTCLYPGGWVIAGELITVIRHRIITVIWL